MGESKKASPKWDGLTKLLKISDKYVTLNKESVY